MLVYLDSQDYSRLTDPRHADKADTVALLSLLQHSAEADVHRFPFSNLHVQEAIHSDLPLDTLALVEHD